MPQDKKTKAKRKRNKKEEVPTNMKIEEYKKDFH